MELFWKAIFLTIAAAILWNCCTAKEFGLLLTLAVTAMVGMAAVSFLRPVFSLFQELAQLGQLQGSTLTTLLKAVGVGLTGEIAGTVCNDAGNASMGKMVQLLSGTVILYLSVPVFTTLMELLGQIMGRV